MSNTAQLAFVFFEMAIEGKCDVEVQGECMHRFVRGCQIL